MKTVSIDGRAAWLSLTLRVRVTGVCRARVRAWLGAQLLKLAQMAFGLPMDVNLEGARPAFSGNVRIVSDGNVCGTRLFLDGGEELRHVSAVRFEHEAGEIPRVTVDLATHPIEAEGRLVCRLFHPVSGELRTISSITFADGSTWPPAPSEGA